MPYLCRRSLSSLIVSSLLGLTLGGLPLATLGQGVAWDWAVSPGEGYGNGVAVALDGHVYVTGSFKGTASFGATTLVSAGGADVFVAKLTSAGAYEWAVSAGGPADDAGNALAVDAGGSVFVIGDFQGTATVGPSVLGNVGRGGTADVFVAKLSPAGAWQWATAASGTENELGRGLALDAGGNVYVTGFFYSDDARFGPTTLMVSSGSTGSDVFVAKLSSAGAWQWAVQAGGRDADFAYGLAVEGTDVLVTGFYRSTTAAFGSIALLNSGGSDVFVARLNAAGTWRWAGRAGGYGDDFAYSVAADGSGGAYVSGLFEGATATFGSATLHNAVVSGGSADVFVARLAPTDTWQWAVRAGGDADDLAYGLALDPQGNAFVTGSFSSFVASFGSTVLTNTGTGALDVFVAKLNPAGAWQWAVPATSSGSEFGIGLAVDSAGAALLTGRFTGRTATFGATTLASTAALYQASSFIARLKPIPLGDRADAPASGFNLAPNPAHATVALSGLPVGSAPATLLDGLGRAVRTATLPNSDGHATLDVRGLPVGLYLVLAGRTARRLIVE